MARVDGIGPYIKESTFRLFIAGSDFTEGEPVKLKITYPDGRVRSRTGVVKSNVNGGCIAEIVGPDAPDDPPDDPPKSEATGDDDLVDITVTVGGESSTEPGIAE